MALYVVTGGAGFIGSHLVDALLAAGERVRVLDDFSTGRPENLPPDAEIMRGDVTDNAALDAALAGAAGCFHLAAIASVQDCNEAWEASHRVNQGGTVAVLEAALRAGRVPVVFASSAAVYGDLAGAAARETMPCRPRTAYGADKRGSELHAAIGWEVHGVPSFGLRLFNVYGKRQDPSSPYSGVISIFAARIAAGQPVTLHGDGRQTRDFISVGDVVAHACAAMRVLRDVPGMYLANVCTGQEVSIRGLVDLLGGVLGAVPSVQHGPPRAGDIGRSVGDPAGAIAMLGVAARTALSIGLREVLEPRLPALRASSMLLSSEGRTA